MHGHSPESVLLVNAEVDSMGGVIHGGVGIDSKTSPRRVAIEKAQAELRQEYDAREERRRELEFLEKGGNPLDFKAGIATSISVQSTSVTDQFVTSEAKGSFATASPHGDSVESSGGPGPSSAREANTADNLLYFDGENDINDGDRNSIHFGRSNNATSDQLSQLDGYHNIKESEDSGMRLVVKSQAYTRRNRSKPGRDSTRKCLTDVASAGDGSGSSALPTSRHGSRDVKGSVCEVNSQKARNVTSICKSTSPNRSVVFKTVDRGLDSSQARAAASSLTKGDEGESDVKLSKGLRDREQNKKSQVDAEQVPIAKTSTIPDVVGMREDRPSSALEFTPCADSSNMENLNVGGQANGFRVSDGDRRDTASDGQNGDVAFCRKGSVDIEPSNIQDNLILDGNAGSDQHLSSRNIHSHGNSIKQIPSLETTPTLAVDVVKGDSGTRAVEVDRNDDRTAACLNPDNNVSYVKNGQNDDRSGLKYEQRPVINSEKMDHNVASNADGKVDNLYSDNPNVKRAAGFNPQGRPPGIIHASNCDLLDAETLTASETQICKQSQIKLADKAHEDSILEEARSIEAKRKRIAELSVGRLPLEHRRKSHWDFVLEEMAWLANDFRQERIWKLTAAAQLCRSVAMNVRSRADKQSVCRKQRVVAHTLAKAVMEFWHSAEILLNSDNPGCGPNRIELSLVGLQKVDDSATLDDRSRETNLEKGINKEQNAVRSPNHAVQGYALRFLKYSSSLDCPIQAEAPVTPVRISDSSIVEMSWNEQFSEEKGINKEQNAVRSPNHAVQDYALRFLKYSSSLDCPIQAEAPVTPDRVSDSSIVEMSWNEQFSEETLFYTVPVGAMEVYRQSVEDFWSQYEKTGGDMHQEEVETSVYDAVAEYGIRENAFEEDERDVGAYYLPGAFEGSKSSKFAQKKQKHLQKSYLRSFEVGIDSPYVHFPENKLGANSIHLGKRPSNSLNSGRIPTKRVRTATRTRIVGPQMPIKTDASSGDTSSFQDDQSTAHGGSQSKRMETESTGEFGKQASFDCTEVTMKHKKKKAKHSQYKNSLNITDTGFVGKGSPYERWQLDSMVPNEQRDYSKKRLDSHAFESNGNNGLLGQHAAKRPKIIKQLQDNSPESIAPINGSISSPVTSQMSNMSNPNKFMKMFAGRDRGRKTKALKMPAGQSGSGSPWSLFEDQALVVLVHDMGPNWELISDAINSTLQFKCIYRKAKECKERHKVLMDRNVGDGADSAEDSGSSQPYPSTLPGIPKGSARQLFQRLQGPLEEDTLKSHFEKIIMIGQKQHSRRSQNDNQALKQIAPVHSSHIAALHQVCPNNLNGVTLTPRDLCEVSPSSSDVLPLGYQGSTSSGVAVSNQATVPPVLPTSGANSVVQGSSAMAHSLPSPSIAPNASTRDIQRYGVPRASSLPTDEHQKMQQYNQMLSGRNIQHSSLPTPGSLPGDRRMLPGGNGGMGMISGINRGMSMPRAGFQGIGSPAMLNMVSSGSMLPSSGVGMPNPVNMHNGGVPRQGNTMMRPREAMHMMRNSEDQRQLMMQELQMQVTQGNSQGIPPYNGLSQAYPNHTVPPPVQAFPVQQQQQHQMPPQQSHVLNSPHHPYLQGGNHATTPQQHAEMLRLAKDRERHIQHQRILHQQHQQHQFAASNASMPHGQPQSHPPISHSLQNNSQIQQQASPQAAPLSSPNAQHPNPTSSQSQQKQLPPHVLGRNPQASGGNVPNQTLKARRQPQQPGRHNSQRQQPSQQQAKVMKGMGRGNMIMHQNLPIDPSQVNGLAMSPGNQSVEKGESIHMMPGQGLFSGPGLNPIQGGKPLVPQPSNQCSSQQKLFSRSPSPSSKQLPQMASHADNNHQGQVTPGSSAHPSLASQPPAIPVSMASPQQLQPQQRQAGQSQQAVHRMLPQNRPLTSGPSPQSVEHVQVNQQSVNQMSTSMTMPQCCSESTSVVPVSSACAPSQWKSQEYDRGTPNVASHLASTGNPPLPSSAGNDAVSSPSQGLGQRQFSGSMSNHVHNVHTQWQPQLQQQKQHPPAPLPQQPSSAPMQHQQPPSLQPQAQPQQQQPQHPPHQHLQSGQGGPYDRPANS